MDKAGAINGILAGFGGNGRGSGHLSAEALSRFHNLPGLLINQLMIVRPDLNPNPLFNFFFFVLSSNHKNV